MWYIRGMADLTNEQREQNEQRRHRKRERGIGRELAREHAVGALDQLIAADASDWFPPDQAHAYVSELQRLRLRISAIGFDGYSLQKDQGLARGRA